MRSHSGIRLALGAIVALNLACGSPQAPAPSGGSAPAQQAAPAGKPAAPGGQAAGQAAAPAGQAAAPAGQAAAPAKNQFENEVVNPAPFAKGGTLRLAHDQTSLHLDPTTSNSNTTHKRVSMIYQHLLVYRPDPKDSRESVLVPQVATKWDLSQDGTTATFALRKDIHWANDPDGLLKGRLLTAQDVVFSYSRWKSDNAPKASLFKNIKDLQAVDDYTVKVTWDKASPQNLATLAADPAWIMPKEAVDKYGDLKNWGYGFGPYNITKHDPNTGTTFERNPTYYEADKVGPDKIEVVIMKDRATAIAAFRSGQIDSLGNYSYLDWTITAEDAKDIKKTNPNIAQIDVPRIGLAAALAVHSNCNCPFDKLEVRQALAHAIDRDALIAAVKQGDGYWSDIFPSEAFPAYRSPEAKLREWFKYDPELSKKLLTTAGYPNGFTTTILWNTDDPDQRKLLDIEVQMLSKVGIKLDTQAAGKAYPAWTGDIFSGRYNELGQWGYVGSTVINFLECIALEGGCRNGTKMADQKVNALVDQVRFQDQANQRPATTQKLSEYLFTEALWVQPLYNDYFHWLIPTQLKNVVIERGGDALGAYHFDNLAYITIQR